MSRLLLKSLIAFFLLISQVPKAFSQGLNPLERDLQKMIAGLPDSPPDLLVGMEIELSVKRLAPLMPLFDFTEYQAKIQEEFGRDILIGRLFSNRGLWSNFFDDYLRDNRSALQYLPEELRAKLTQGLQLQSELWSLPSSSMMIRGPVSPWSPPQQSLNTENHITGDYRSQNGQLLLPASHDWDVLDARWRALDFETKLDAVNWDYLSATKKARIILDNRTMYMIHLPKIKSNVPKEIQDFFSRLEWHIDGDTLEFTHREPVRDLRLFAEDVLKFSRLAGVELKILNSLESKMDGVSFHFHISRTGQNRTQQFHRKINTHLMLKRLSLGIISDLKGGHFTYDFLLNSRGLIRRFDPTHMEVRNHPYPFFEELDLVAKLHFVTEEEAIRKLNELTGALITPEVVETIEKHDRQYYLLDFIELFPKKKQSEIIQAYVQRIEDNGHYLTIIEKTPFPPDIWSELSLQLKNMNYQRALITSSDLHIDLDRALARTPNPWNAHILDFLFSIMASEDVEQRDFALKLFAGRRQWSDGEWHALNKKLEKLPARELKKFEWVIESWLDRRMDVPASVRAAVQNSRRNILNCADLFRR